jgi:hypothetical protein
VSRSVAAFNTAARLGPSSPQLATHLLVRAEAAAQWGRCAAGLRALELDESIAVLGA